MYGCTCLSYLSRSGRSFFTPLLSPSQPIRHMRTTEQVLRHSPCTIQTVSMSVSALVTSFSGRVPRTPLSGPSSLCSGSARACVCVCVWLHVTAWIPARPVRLAVFSSPRTGPYCAVRNYPSTGQSHHAVCICACECVYVYSTRTLSQQRMHKFDHGRTPLCRLCGRLDDLISELTRAVGATVTAGTVILIGLPRMAR